MRLNKKIFISIGVFAVLIICGISTILFKNLNKAHVTAMNYDFTVVAEIDDNSGVDINSGFIITSAEDYTLDVVKDIIKIEPQIDYDIIKKGSGSYYLKTKTALNNNTVYNIHAVNEYEPDVSWAFQTQANFSITSTLPTDKGENVPINTGIEMMFSKMPTNIQNYFSISPNVKGKFEIIGKKICFIPSDSLKYNTEYKIKINSGFKATDGSELLSDYIYSFTTMSMPKSQIGNIYATNELHETFTSKDTHLVEMYVVNGDFSNEKFYVDIYDLQSPENYIEQIKNIENGTIDTSKYEKITDFETNLVTQNNDDYYVNYSYIIFPENLSSGWYLVDITTGIGLGDTKNQHVQKLIQVTDMSVYIQSYNAETVVWCNDVSTGLAVANANIKIEDITETTNNNGVAIMYLSQDKKVPVYITSPDGKRFAEYMYLSESIKYDFDDMYYIYFYTDREVYLPTDTLNYWGVILPKKTEAVVPDFLTLTWHNEEIKVPIDSKGSFSGKIAFSKLISGYNSIKLSIDDLETYAKFVEICEYVKPTYVLESSFDKVYYKSGETAKITVTGSFFDGTPAEALQLKTVINQEEQTITLGSNGNRTISQRLYKETDNWMPTTVYANIYTTGNDEDASTYTFANYFPTNYMFNAHWDVNNLVLEANKIDFAKITDTSLDYDKIKGGSSVASGTVSIIKNQTVKTEIGEYYDYINKVTKKKYSYDTVKTIIDTIPFTTVNGKANIELDYPKEDAVYYTAEIAYTLPDGFNGVTKIDKYYYNVYSHYGDYKEFSFNTDNSYFATKDEVNLKLNCNNEIVENEGKILYAVLQNNIKDLAVTQKSNIKLTYNELYIPNIAVCGAYFDGIKIYPINICHLYFDTKERELKIKITTDKESYKPGDTVNMTVEVSDKYGQTYPTNLVMSVVDEAAFAISNQYVNALSDLYSYNYYYPNQYVSYVQHTNFVTAEGGGDGTGAAYRSNFEDTAEFITITTGSNGKTNASFKLPDNLTSWRITVIGITENVRAGSNIKNITINLPFYINQVINEKYASNDTVVFSARIAGTEKNNLTENINYTATIIGKGFEKTIDLYEGKNDVAIFDFGMLSEGEYEIFVRAMSGNYSDGIKKTIYVIDSLHEIMQSKEIDLAENIDIKALKFPVNLMFYSTDNVLYYSNIEKILDTSWGTTNEQKIARNIVYEKLNSFSEKSIYSLSEITELQTYSGGAKYLEYSDEDILLTAKLCALAPQYLDTVKAKSYFESIINNSSSTSSEVSAAYFGLAALKEPVINDIKYLLNNNKGFSTRDNINLISGLACIGDINGANEWYVKILSKDIKENEQCRYIQIGDSTSNYEATSSLIIPLVKMNQSDLSMFINYVIKQKSTKYTPCFDLTAYLTEFSPKNSEGFVKYELNNEKKDIDFEGKPVVNLVLNEKEIKNIKITDYNKVTCKAFYMGGITDVVNDAFNKIIVEKHLTGGKNIGDTVTTTIKIKFPGNSEKNTKYVLTDVVPTGMRYIGYNREYNSNYYLKEHEAQKLYFVITNKDNSDITITYNTRNLLPGEYFVDSAVVENIKENIKGYSTTSSYVIENE